MSYDTVLGGITIKVHRTAVLELTIVYVNMRVHYMLYPAIIVMIVRNWILKAAFVLTIRKWPTVLDNLNFHILILMKALAKLFTGPASRYKMELLWKMHEVHLLRSNKPTFCQ